MSTPVPPTPCDIDQYRQMRGHMSTFISRLVDDIPNQAWHDVAEALGLDFEVLTEGDHKYNIVADCCFFDWFDQNRRNIVERYAEKRHPRPGTDESVVLNAYLQAKYRVMLPQSAVPNAGVYCRDAMDQTEFFLLDLALSRTRDFTGMVYAARTIPFGEYWITTCSGIPVTHMDDSKAASTRFAKLNRKWPGHVSRSVLVIRRFLTENEGRIVLSREDPSLPPRDPLRAPRRTFATA